MADTIAGLAALYFTPARVTARPARCRSVVAVNNLQTRPATSVKIIAGLGTLSDWTSSITWSSASRLSIAQVPPNIALAASENGAVAVASLAVGTMPNTAVRESM